MFMIKDTICRLCSACCPIEADIRDGKLVAAERKPSLPIGQSIKCPKLMAAPDIVYSKDRLTTPLVKSGDGFRETSWDEALDLVTRKFHYFKEAHGAETIAWLRGMAADWGAPWDYANRLMNVFGSPNTIGNGSVCHVARDMAHVYTYGAMTLPQPKNAKCIVVWGKNDWNTAPAAYEAISHARQQGASLIVIDPVKTPLASGADIWLQIKPGHDGYLALAMIREIIVSGLYDGEFVRNFTLGFDELRKAAEHYPPETVAGRIWLEPEQIREAARLYATTRPACIIDGNGLDMQLQAFQSTRAVAMLRALTGNLDRDGGDFIPQAVPLRNIQLRERLPGRLRSISMNYPLFNEFHPTWGRHAQSSLIDAIMDERPYPVNMLVVQSGNPAVTMTDSNRVIKALQKLDFLVVIDLFLNRTAQFADVVLPASSCFEKTQLNRAYMRNNPVILQNQVIGWLGKSWPDWKIVFELGRRLGFEQDFPWRTAEEAIDYQLKPSGLTVDMLRQNPAGLRVEELQYEKYLTKGFDTPSGKVEFFSKRLEENGHAPIPYMDGRIESPISFSAQSDELPMIGISGERTNPFTHTQFHRVPALINRDPQPFVDLHPENAYRMDISEGDPVTVQTPRGHIRMQARISDAVHPGSARIAWGWGELDPGLSLNNLTDDDHRDPVTGSPSNRSFMCRIEKGD
jgi:anaerobic selenocysteine-containing dehydrogenase